MRNGDGLAWHCWSLLEICWIGSAVGSGISLMQSRRKRYTSARLHHWQLPLTLYICFQCVFFSAYVSWGGCKSIAKALWCHRCELGGSGWVREQVTCCICRHEEIQKGSGYSSTSCWPWTNFLKQEKKKSYTNLFHKYAIMVIPVLISALPSKSVSLLVRRCVYHKCTCKCVSTFVLTYRHKDIQTVCL